MERLFVYGTLKEPAVQQAVFGRIVQGVPDVLDGFRVSRLVTEEEVYPIIVPDADSAVEGLVIEVTAAELALIDEYETDAYRRIQVRLRSGLETWVYSE